MKNFDIMERRRRACGGGRSLRIDLVAGNGTQNTADNDPVAGRDPFRNHAHSVNQRADFHLALLNDVVLIHDQDVAAALVAAEGDIRH